MVQLFGICPVGIAVHIGYRADITGLSLHENTTPPASLFGGHFLNECFLYDILKIGVNGCYDIHAVLRLLDGDGLFATAYLLDAHGPFYTTQLMVIPFLQTGITYASVSVYLTDGTPGKVTVWVNAFVTAFVENAALVTSFFDERVFLQCLTLKVVDRAFVVQIKT